MSEVVIDYKKNDAGKKTYYVRRSEEEDTQKRRTTIIVSHKNIIRLRAVGNYGETYNHIVRKLIAYDIKVQAYKQKLKEQQGSGSQ